MKRRRKRMGHERRRKIMGHEKRRTRRRMSRWGRWREEVAAPSAVVNGARLS